MEVESCSDDGVVLYLTGDEVNCAYVFRRRQPNMCVGAGNLGLCCNNLNDLIPHSPIMRLPVDDVVIAVRFCPVAFALRGECDFFSVCGFVF